jgi:lysophospholipase L1-like esterase
MSWTKKLFFLAVAVFIPLTLGVVLLELIFGSWLRNDEWSKTRTINIVRDVKITYDVENIYGNELSKVVYTRDKNGLRGSCSDPREINILTIGGSTTDQRYIPDGKTYQDVLQLLLTTNRKEKVCISNAGVDGHSTFGHIESFNIWFPLIDGLKPKYILFYVGINDAGFRNAPNSGFDTSERSDTSSIRNILRQKSAIYDLLRTLRNMALGMSDTRAYAGHSPRTPSEDAYLASKKTDGLDDQIKKNTESFEKRFEKLMSQTLAYGAIPICVSQPHLYIKNIDGVKKGVENLFSYEGVTYSGVDYDESITSLSKSMKDLCLKSGGFFIDIASKNFERGDFYDGVHMTPKGAKRLGKYLFGEFTSQKISIQ